MSEARHERMAPPEIDAEVDAHGFGIRVPADSTDVLLCQLVIAGDGHQLCVTSTLSVLDAQETLGDPQRAIEVASTPPDQR